MLNAATEVWTKCLRGKRGLWGLTLGKTAQSSWPGKTNEFTGRAMRSQSVCSKPERIRREVLGGESDVWGTGEGRQPRVCFIYLG